MSKKTSKSAEPVRGSALEVFLAFLKLGLTSFGGPIAHLGYFRTEFVEKRRWLSDVEYSELVVMCQFLPGPASSQVGFAIGMMRAGFRGAISAFVGFTLPSALLMLGFAYGVSIFSGDIVVGLVTGLNIVAVSIVGQAVWAMARNLTAEPITASIAFLAFLVVLIFNDTFGQISAIIFGAVTGLLFCRSSCVESGKSIIRYSVRKTTASISLAFFGLVLFVTPFLVAATGSNWLKMFEVFFRSGALVFGGGHVVLPLLQSSVVDSGWVNSTDFLSGYGAAQAVPGPLFTFASYLGAIANVGPGGSLGSLIALIAIFLPGFLLLIGLVPFWNSVRNKIWMQAIVRGAGAAVVGILGYALLELVLKTAATGIIPILIALACFVLLVKWKMPSWAAVLICSISGLAITLSIFLKAL